MHGKALVERIKQLRQVAFALGHRKTAGRQRHTGHRITPQAGPWR